MAPFLMSSSYFKRKEKYIKQFLSWLCLKQILYITLNELIEYNLKTNMVLHMNQ